MKFSMAIRRSLLLLMMMTCSSFICIAQGISSSNTHSHNDYEQQRPFALAYENRFGSIEADIWLKDGLLVVAHDAKDIDPNKTLSVLYLDPLVKRIEENRGHVYPDKKKELQLLIDIKSDGIST